MSAPETRPRRLGETGYAPPNAWEQARRRLALLEACHDPASIRRAEALGVGGGWHCLDAGAGGGSFARWLARRVGDTGSVVAVDLDVRLLEHATTPGLEVRRLDLVADELPRDAFDPRPHPPGAHPHPRARAGAPAPRRHRAPRRRPAGRGGRHLPHRGDGGPRLPGGLAGVHGTDGGRRGRRRMGPVAAGAARGARPGPAGG